jgi:UDP-N-acetylglucosamine--N-acetylmuramyl-(pentapeptide) pyrophosphoryl-undecaprenol N-acetylglucosamine transferase
VKLVVAGGGTGGHVYPGLTVVESMQQPRGEGLSQPALAQDDVLWIGSRGGMEEGLVKHAGLEFVGLPAGGLRGKAALPALRNAVQIARSVGRARHILTEFEADIVLATGGYASVSVALAARRERLPVVIYLPDIVPGLAIRFLSRFATRVAVTNEKSYPFFRRDKVVVTGYPVRPEIYHLDRAEALAALELDPAEKTLLVMGGSRGARSINRAIVGGLRQLLPHCQIVHVSGRLDADWVAGAGKSLPPELQQRYHHHAYLHDFAQAVVAADLAVARAGAATLGEFPAAGLASILVPYPYSGQHQLPNAEHMAESGAAQIVMDAALEEELVPAVLALLEDQEMLDSMGRAARSLDRTDAAQAIAEQLWLLARQAVPSTSPAAGPGDTEP